MHVLIQAEHTHGTDEVCICLAGSGSKEEMQQLMARLCDELCSEPYYKFIDGDVAYCENESRDWIKLKIMDTNASTTQLLYVEGGDDLFYESE